MVAPRVCVVCGEPLVLHERYICVECLADMPYTRFWEMERNEMADKLNARIEPAREEPYCSAVALFDYNAASSYRHITPHLKYGGGLASGRFFGRLLGHRIASCPYLGGIDCIVPVPLHWRRRLSRGYNQAGVIASAVSESLGVPVRGGLLRRARYSRSQTAVGVEGKSANVRGAFRASPAVPAPAHILVVDDVFTTGSTLAACHSALRDVFDSSTRISVATLAYVSES